MPSSSIAGAYDNWLATRRAADFESLGRLSALAETDVGMASLHVRSFELAKCLALTESAVLTRWTADI